MEESGIKIVYADSEGAKKKGDRLVLETSKGEIEAERILMAAGRLPNLDGLRLEEIGVKTERGAVAVDKYFNSS